MSLMIKGLTKEVLKNRIFLVLLFAMTVFTSFMFYFIRFSIDANIDILNRLQVLTENQQDYMQALNSNTSLATMFLLVMTAVTALIFVMFYFRFFASAKKQIGVYKALGHKNISIQMYFVMFAVIFSLAGLLTGMLAGYFASSVHLQANMRSYSVIGLVKGINFYGILLGIGLPLLAFALTMYVCGLHLYTTENGTLITEVKQIQKQPVVLTVADACVRVLPIKNKAPLRIAIRNPLSVLLILTAVTVFTVMLVLGWSITQSGEIVYNTQTEGHHYGYESTFEQVQTERAAGDAIYFLSIKGIAVSHGDDITQTLFGMDITDSIFALQSTDGKALGALEDGYCYISLGMSEMYSITAGDGVTMQTDSADIQLTVKDVAYNAKSNTVITSREYLAGLLSMDSLSYNGVLSADNLYPDADKVIDSAARQDLLDREKVSSATSAILNQSIGLASGVILIFLALFITFQSSLKDMLIMDSLGYTRREIKRLLINVFLPVLIISFVIMAFPSVLIAQVVQTSLSLAMGDYMPFVTNIFVPLVGLAIVTAIYWLVQLVFTLGIKHATKKQGILEYTNSL